MSKAKIVIEILFERPDIQRGMLEELVQTIAEQKPVLLRHLSLVDEKAQIRVRWDGVASSSSAARKPSFLDIFARRKK